MLPVILNSSAMIRSEADATQYAPEAPTSLIKAMVGFSMEATFSAISFDATTVPPGELISIIIALTPLFFSALLVLGLFPFF